MMLTDNGVFRMSICFVSYHLSKFVIHCIMENFKQNCYSKMHKPIAIVIMLIFSSNGLKGILYVNIFACCQKINKDN